MDMKLKHKQAFKVIGYSAQFKAEESYIKCREFLEKEYTLKYQHLLRTGKPENADEQAVLDNHIGTLSLLIERAEGFEYMIAGVYEGGNVPDGMKKYSFPESDWAVFSSKGALIDSLLKLNNKIRQEWNLSQKQDYLPIGRAALAYCGEEGSAFSERECSIWVPVISKMIAPCGLDCTKCDAYIATVKNDSALRERTAKLWAEANSAPITPEMINCLGCRGDKVKTPYCESMCEIRKCAAEKNHDFCSCCDEADNCVNIKAVIDNSEEALSNFSRLHLGL